MPQPTVITIDGPAGAGKSTLGALLAERLSYLYFDTGVMYRALTLAALRAAIDLNDEAALSELAERIEINVVPPTNADGRQYTVLADGQDITWDIRSPEVERGVSLAARFPGVRREMVRQQQQIGQKGQVVMVGRDIGTVVMPDAELKIYLQASLDERARRRTGELASKQNQRSIEQVRDDIARRDELDRHVSQSARDAITLHTDDLSPEEEVHWIINYIEQHY